MNSPYQFTLHDSIADVDRDAWNGLRRGERDPFMDPQFLRAIEQSMSATGRFRYVLFTDAEGHAAACACMSSYRVNSAHLANGFAKKLLTFIGGILPFITRFNVVFCGVPFSAGQSNLRISPEADAEAIVRQLDELLTRFAKEEHARCTVYKEFTAEECEQLNVLESLGYLRADSMPMNHTNPDFKDFDDYLSSLKSRKRYPIQRSRKKFAKSGLRVVQMTGRDGADRYLTKDVHALYEYVYDRAEVRLERLSPGVFPEMARQMPDNTGFTFVFQDDRVVAFAASVFTSEVFHQMFVGYAAELNHETDLYFNLFYNAIDFAFQRHVSDIFVGQSADTFKHRNLNCYHVPLYFFVKGMDPAIRFVIRHGQKQLFPAHNTSGE